MTLELNGKQERLNFKVEANRGKCVNSSNPDLRNAEGEFAVQRYGGGPTFLTRLTAGNWRATQIWILRPDGTYAIRENPDRGEQESAVRVDGDSISTPAAKNK